MWSLLSRMVYYIIVFLTAAMHHKVTSYSQQLVGQLPMKLLLQTAQREQYLYAGLFSPLLRSVHVILPLLYATLNYRRFTLEFSW